MAEHQNKSQEEYNELLGISQSMLKEISDALSETSEKTDKRNKKLVEQISLTKSIIDEVKDEKSLLDAIGLIQENNKDIAKQNFGVNQKLVDTYKLQSTALEGILKRHQSAAKILSKVNSIVDYATDKFSGIFETIHHGLGEIPLIGKDLANAFHPFQEKSKEMFTATAEGFKNGFKDSFSSALKDGKSFTSATFSGITGGFGEAMSTARAFAASIGPIGIAIMAIGAAVGLGVARFHQIEKAAQEFKEKTGLASVDIHEIEHTVRGVNEHFASLGVSLSDVSGYMSDFTEEFDGLTVPAESTVAAIAVLNKNFGVTAKSASAVNKIFQNMGGLTETQSQYLANSVVEMSNMVGVSPEKVMKDMADNAGEAYKFFRGSPEELAKAAVYAAKMGSSIKDMTASANKLLDFESSISSELEASALLGTNLDFSKARELAYTGDLLGMQKELTKELANVGDISKLSTYEKEALVNATGQELDTLMNTQRIYTQFGDLDEARLAAANALIDSGKDIRKVGREELEQQTQRMAKQKLMQDMMSDISNQAEGIKVAFMDMFAPLGGFAIKLLKGIVNILASGLIPTLRFVGEVVSFILSPFVNLLDLIQVIAEEGLGGMVRKLQEMGPIMSTIVGFVGTLAAIWIIQILPAVLSTVASLAIGMLGALFTGIGAVWTFAAGLITSAIAAISTMSALTLGIGAIAIVGGIAAAATAMNSQTSTATAEAESVQDGVISPGGNVISTSPDDFLIATKNPGALAQTVSQGGGGVSMEAVVAELRELKAAFMANKDVYLDGQLVTSRIASVASKNPIT